MYEFHVCFNVCKLLRITEFTIFLNRSNRRKSSCLPVLVLLLRLDWNHLVPRLHPLVAHTLLLSIHVQYRAA